MAGVPAARVTGRDLLEAQGHFGRCWECGDPLIAGETMGGVRCRSCFTRMRNLDQIGQRTSTWCRCCWREFGQGRAYACDGLCKTCEWNNRRGKQFWRMKCVGCRETVLSRLEGDA